MKLCFSGKYTQAEVSKMINGNGGFNAYVGTNDMRDLVKMAKDDEKAQLVMDAFHYQLAKEIGAMAVVLGGKVDQYYLNRWYCLQYYHSGILQERCKFPCSYNNLSW